MSAAGKGFTTRLKYLSTINDDVLDENTSADFEMQYIDIGNVDSSGRINALASYRLEDAPSRARRRVRDGDTIISTVRTYLQAITQIHDPPENLIVSTGFAVVRPLREKFDANYCRFALCEPSFLAEVAKRSVGVSYPAINASDLANIPIYIYPLEKQRAIADYLDRETGRMDALVAVKERLLELLAEKHQALIARAVTRGLDPDVRLRSSGVEWLGDVPAHWDTKRADALLEYRKVFVPQSEFESTDVFHYSIPAIQETGDGIVEAGAEIDSGKIRLNGGELIVSKLNPHKGCVLLTESKGLPIVASTEFVPLVAKSGFDFQFAFYVYSSTPVREFISSTVRSVTRSHQRTNPESITKLWLPLPPLSEQRAITDYLDRETSKLDALAAKARGIIGLLKERRAALISAAVTGKIDIGGCA